MSLTTVRRQALAARDAHLALLDLKKLVDNAARTAHAAEIEAVGLALRQNYGQEIPSGTSAAMENLRNLDFEPGMSQAREKLRMALLWYRGEADLSE
jgi:pimeloyl-ACP methyl ester carboxylesterase